MTRATNAPASRERRKKMLKLAKGFRGRAKSCYRTAANRVEHGLQFAYRDRKARKREFRRLWIQRINAGARENGLVYSTFMNGLAKAGIELDRKVLADIAVHDAAGFAALAKQAQDALAKAA
jgi:large subunit ribosomal protein L20